GVIARSEATRRSPKDAGQGVAFHRHPVEIAAAPSTLRNDSTSCLHDPPIFRDEPKKTFSN
ncbi:MAG: hypothetical protein IKW76_13050, partial [Clostridia bacterium]|nr:hypothetical protein [Clostridia bacterium]